MIVIDTHIWIWWVHNHADLKPWMRSALVANEASGIRVSAIPCWEIARLVAGGKLDLQMSTSDWFSAALAYPGVDWVDLTPEISIDANNLPGWLHKDPADRIIVATSRILGCKLLTAGGKILDYINVDVVTPE